MKDYTEFIENVKNCDTRISRKNFIHKNIFHGIPYVFNGNEGKYYDFRKRIADFFQIQYYEVFIVGSARLGFSYVKKTDFSFDSDIDIAIVNNNLFESYYKKIAEFQYIIDRKTITKKEYEDYLAFLKYLAKGWMRPELLPHSFEMKSIKDEWFNFFRSISNGKSEAGNYEVSAGLYKDFTYLEMYYLKYFEDKYTLIKD